MSKTTVIGLAGKRLSVRPSPTSVGSILIQIISAGRDVQASITLAPDAAAVFADVLALAAVEAESDAALLDADINAGVEP